MLEVSAWDPDDAADRATGSARSPGSPCCSPTTSRCGAAPDPTPTRPGEQVGGQDRGTWYYKNLAIHIVNYAQGAYEGFDGEPDVDLDAVDLTTVHRAKGLEWPVVFVPSMTASRFPYVEDGHSAGLAAAPRRCSTPPATRAATPTSAGCSTWR